MIQLGEQQFRRYARRGKRRLIRKSRKDHYSKSAAVRHWEGIRIYRKVGVDASQTWFGALFNCRFDRFVSDYKTIQPTEPNTGFHSYSGLFKLMRLTAQITWLGWTRSWAAWWSRGWPPSTSPSPGWRSASPRWRRGLTSSTRLVTRFSNLYYL